MTFNGWTYAAFLALVVLLRLAIPERFVVVLLLGSSLVFYGWGSPADLLVLLPLLVAVHFIARRARPDRSRAKAWTALGVTLSLGLLAYFKYRHLAADALNASGALVGVPLDWGVSMSPAPLGISFFVFLVIHYLVEVHRGRVSPARPSEEALFVLFFPTVVAGPLKRIDAFVPQLRPPTRASAEDVSEGLGRILVGLAKKTLVADQLAPLCLPVFRDPSAFSWAELWLASYGYAVQIYFDFSGLSDMAIGSARMLGLRVPENFDYPYFRTNVAEFWRHWHMTLTGWILEYVYIPLGGNRRGEIRTYWNRTVAMTLCGLWHGGAVHFAVWGAYHGLLLNLYHLYRKLRARVLTGRPEGSDHPLARLGAGLLTFHLVVIGWVFFAADLDAAAHMLGRMLLFTDR